MKTTTLQRALIGLWIAERSLDTFLDECDEMEEKYPQGSWKRLTDEDCEKIRKLAALPPDDALAWRYQLRQMLAIFETCAPPCFLKKAKKAEEFILAPLVEE